MTAKLRSTLYLVIALLVLVTAAQAMAHSNTGVRTENELTGVVTAITPTTITIGTMTFDIAQAEVNDTILQGDVVTVHYSTATDGTLVAREVQLFAITPEATESMDANETPEATEAFDDHGQDNPATHVEDQHQGQDDGSQQHGSGSTGSPAPTSTQIADDHGHDGAGSQSSQGTPQPQQEDHGGHQGDDGGHSGHGGHGG